MEAEAEAAAAMATAAAATGAVRVEKVRGRSAVTRCFAKYPLKLIAPSKVGHASSGAAWLYAITYGGGIVSGDIISCTVAVGDGCTAAMTTQASTKEYNVVAMVILLGPKLKHIQDQMQDEVKKMMSVQLRPPTSAGGRYSTRSQPLHPQRPPIITSCSPFGRMGTGMLARITAVSTESVYSFLRHHLAALEPFLGACPYSAS